MPHTRLGSAERTRELLSTGEQVLQRGQQFLSPRTPDELLIPGQSASELIAGRRGAANVAESTPTQQFSLALLDLLKQQQQLGTRPFVEQELAGVEAQAERVFQTPSELIGASPQLQSNVRGAAVGALEPTIRGAQTSQRTFGEQIRGFGSAVEAARLFGQDFEEREQKSKDARKQSALFSVNIALKTGADALEALINQSPNIFKAAGVDAEAIRTLLPALKEKERLEQLPTSPTPEEITATENARGESLGTLSLINEVLESPQLKHVIGKSRFLIRARLAGTQLVRNQIDQIKATLSLENRRLLKGQGTISDFEAKILQDAATALDVSLTDKDFERELRKIRGVFANAAGLESVVIITNPATGESQVVRTNRDGINQALADGMRVEYQ